MSAERTTENWLPITDFSVKTGISISTLRRYIKAEKISFKIENGRYLLCDDGKITMMRNFRNPSADLSDKVAKLEQELKNAQQELAELKMLVALYEEKIPQGLDN